MYKNIFARSFKECNIKMPEKVLPRNWIMFYLNSERFKFIYVVNQGK